MNQLTDAEVKKINKNICPDCESPNGFLGGPKGCGSQNILCDNCKMRFNIGIGDVERIGVYIEPTISEPVNLLGEGHITLDKDNGHISLTHSCGGSIDLHIINDDIACIVCRKCCMRLKLKNDNLTSITLCSDRLVDLFEHIKSHEFLS